MIDIKLLRDNPDLIKKAVERKGYKIDVDEIIELDKRRRELIQEIEKYRRQAKEIAGGGANVSEESKEKGSQLKEKIRVKEKELSVIEDGFSAKFTEIPNPAFDDVPDGKTDKENKEIKIAGERRGFDFGPKDHVELAQINDLLDFEAGAKLAGSHFFYLKNDAAMLELSLIHYALDVLRKEGFQVIFTPDLAKSRFYLATRR